SGAVEINSFHALYPDEFRAILVNFITSYFDEEIKDKVKEFNEEQSDIIKEHVSNDDNINSLLGDFLKALTETIDKLDWEAQEKDYNGDFETLLEEHQELDYSDRDEHYQWLIDSELDYFEQLNRYNEYEAGELDNPEEEGEP
ncbi:MAG: hypothetical protein KGD60_15895, partial [Candidatus Thorarchaeota archaeon]|nr:hypothetical protein [Candidatus Thorarchaeota archaeon]